MTTLGIDPGMRYVGLCLATLRADRPVSEFTGPARARQANARTSPYGRAEWRRAHDAVGTDLWATTTWRRYVQMDERIWIGTVCDDMRTYVQLMESRGTPIHRVALEDFTHRTYVGRPITTAPHMGELVGRLEERLGLIVPVVRIPAEVSKAGMQFMRRFHRNTHEFSAWCVAVASQRKGVRMTVKPQGGTV